MLFQWSEIILLLTCGRDVANKRLLFKHNKDFARSGHMVQKLHSGSFNTEQPAPFHLDLPLLVSLTQPGEKGAHGPKATAPKGPDLRHPTQVREMGRKRHTCFANRLETSLKEPAERI